MRCETCKYYSKEQMGNGYLRGSHCRARTINKYSDDKSSNPARVMLSVIRDDRACEYYEYNEN